MDGSGSGPQQRVFVVPDEVRAYGREVYGVAEALKSALKSAGTDVDDLLSGGWTGDAAAGFANGWQETREGGQRILRALTMLAEKLGVDADNYQGNEDGSAANFSGLKL
ncbi:WXG100 family type VII secretion target [Nocardia iowensis]|uniref:WXG100 family type VII secretion target n=1 Tax=Nocardia iowensis TaxID=204891 RepID=A0ABX8RGE9_NOCIO|nr:WXG100 family type VII secretion target [Nocardia iowensis]QXN88673.1 WXG100 family type VII secretion target [Nocardia iowensis]